MNVCAGSGACRLAPHREVPRRSWVVDAASWIARCRSRTATGRDEAMMQAAPSMAEPISVNLPPPDGKVVAGGEPVEIVANLRNAWTTVDQYSLEVENLDPSWYTVGAQ